MCTAVSMMLPDELEWVLEMLGYRWPTADEDKLRESANLWRRFGDDVTGLHTAANASARTVVAHNSGASIDAFTKTYAKFDGGNGSDGYLANAAQAACTIANVLEACAYLVELAKWAVIAQLIALAFEIAAAQAAAPFTFGLSEAGALGATQATRLIVRRLLDELKEALMEAIVEAMKEPAISAIEAIITDLIRQTVNVGFGAQQGYDLGTTVAAGANAGWDAIKQTPQTLAEGVRDSLGQKAGHSFHHAIDSRNNGTHGVSDGADGTDGEGADGAGIGEGDSGSDSSADSSSSSDSSPDSSSSSSDSSSSTRSDEGPDSGGDSRGDSGTESAPGRHIGGGISADIGGADGTGVHTPDVGGGPGSDSDAHSGNHSGPGSGLVSDGGSPSDAPAPRHTSSLADFDDPAPGGPSHTPSGTDAPSSAPGTPGTGHSSVSGLSSPTPHSTAPSHPSSDGTAPSPGGGRDGGISTSIDSLAASVPTQPHASPSSTPTDHTPGGTGGRPDGGPTAMPTAPTTGDGPTPRPAQSTPGPTSATAGSTSPTRSPSPEGRASGPVGGRIPSSADGRPSGAGSGLVSGTRSEGRTPGADDGRTPRTPEGRPSATTDGRPSGTGTTDGRIPTQRTPGTASDNRTTPPRKTPGDRTTPRNTPDERTAPRTASDARATPRQGERPNPRNTPNESPSPRNTPSDRPSPRNTPSDGPSSRNAPNDGPNPRNTPADRTTPRNNPSTAPGDRTPTRPQDPNEARSGSGSATPAAPRTPNQESSRTTPPPSPSNTPSNRTPASPPPSPDSPDSPNSPAQQGSAQTPRGTGTPGTQNSPGSRSTPQRPNQPAGTTPGTPPHPNGPQQPAAHHHTPQSSDGSPDNSHHRGHDQVTPVPIHSVTPAATPPTPPPPTGHPTPQAPGAPHADSGTSPQQHPHQESLTTIRDGLDHYPGGLTEPHPADQQALLNAVPHQPDGTPQRFPDPFGNWSQLQNDGGNQVPGRSNNCADCSRSFLETWYGNPQVSAPRTLDVDEHGNPDPWSPEHDANENQIRWSGATHIYAGTGNDPDTPARIAWDLHQGGHGSAAIVQVDWPGGGGHAFNAVNHHGNIVWIDTQSGAVSHQPLHIPNAARVWHIPLDPHRNPIHPPPPPTTPHHDSATPHEGTGTPHETAAQGVPHQPGETPHDPSHHEGSTDGKAAAGPDHPLHDPSRTSHPRLPEPEAVDSTHYGMAPMEHQAALRETNDVRQVDLDPVHQHLNDWLTPVPNEDGNSTRIPLIDAVQSCSPPRTDDPDHTPVILRHDDLARILPGFEDMHPGERGAVVASLARLSHNFHASHAVGASPEPTEGYASHGSNAHQKAGWNASHRDDQELRQAIEKEFGRSGISGALRSSGDHHPDFTGRNYAALEVYDPAHHRISYVVDSSYPNPGGGEKGKHSEPNLLDYLEKVNAARTEGGAYEPLSMYSGREPCGHGQGYANCANLLSLKMHNVDVYYGTGYRKNAPIVDPTPPPQGTYKKQFDKDLARNLATLGKIWIRAMSEGGLRANPDQ
ncbi:toxin glutamine deamidase domain-containing protein [Streptomyces sp. NPDC096198]|uniref:toxin glutamine deamidase domain-containing protein n=1 Tax=Streptomyces sp. NPDC096198 TaxID=3366080 RepID=UPI003827C6D7